MSLAKKNAFPCLIIKSLTIPCNVIIALQHSADQFERLLKEMCADEDGDLLIESAVKNTPKVCVISTLVNTMPAQPFVFRNYQVHLNSPFVV